MTIKTHIVFHLLWIIIIITINYNTTLNKIHHVPKVTFVLILFNQDTDTDQAQLYNSKFDVASRFTLMLFICSSNLNLWSSLQSSKFHAWPLLSRWTTFQMSDWLCCYFPVFRNWPLVNLKKKCIQRRCFHIITSFITYFQSIVIKCFG